MAKNKTSHLFTSEDSIDTMVHINQWINGSQEVNDIMANNKKIEVIIKKATSSRTKAANDFYWAVIIEAFRRSGWDVSKDEMHEILGEHFRVVRKSAEQIVAEVKAGVFKTEWKTKGSSDMNSFDFWEYVESCKDLLAESGGSLDEEEWEQYKEVKKLYDKKGNKNG